jgi:glycine cleavage system aminomethyltransferase T
VTSAAWSAAAHGVIGLGYVRAGTDAETFVDPTGRFMAIRRACVPFIDPAKRRVRGGWDSNFLPIEG